MRATADQERQWRPHRTKMRGAKLAGISLCLFFAISSPAQTTFVIGISVHLANNPILVPSQVPLIGEAGASSLRDDVYWSHLEVAKDHLVMPSNVDDLVNQALQANVQPLFVLGYGNSFYDSGKKPASPEALSAFARYAVFVVQHFKGRVHTYEMWNEWDDTAGGNRPGTPQDYVRFLKVVYPAVKAADPSAVFVAGAVSVGGLDWLSGMLSSGGLGFFDAISTHPYNFTQRNRTPGGWAANMLATEAVIHRYTGGRDLPLYISEMGWPTYTGPGGSSPKEAGAFLAQLFLLARTMSFIKGIWWYDLRDDGTDISRRENTFGLVDASLKPKPAFIALKTVAPVVKEASTVENLPTDNPSLRAVRFRYNEKKQVLALWNQSEPGAIRVHVSGSTPLQIRSADDLSAHPKGAGAKDQELQISDVPVLITGTNLTLKSN